jgi:hypothetical protein
MISIKVFGLNRNVQLPFWNTSKRFGFVPIISFDFGTFVLPFGIVDITTRDHLYSSNPEI